MSVCCTVHEISASKNGMTLNLEVGVVQRH